MNSPHKNVDFSDGQKNTLLIHAASTAIPLVISHQAWLRPHYHKLINTSLEPLLANFLRKIYTSNRNSPKNKIFYMMWLHVKSGLININSVINWFSLSTWYVWLFFWKMHKAAARRKSKGHIKLLNKKCLFLRSYADLVWTHSTVQVFFCECASYPFMQFKLRRMNTPSLASQFFW